MTDLEPTFTDILLILLPTEIGRMQPSLFQMAHSLAPYSIGTANSGTSPISMTLNRSVKADRRRDPAPLNHGPSTNEGGQGGDHLARQKLQHEKTRFLFEHLLMRRLPELQTHQVGREG